LGQVVALKKFQRQLAAVNEALVLPANSSDSAR
jgi:hypothetical protein